MGRAGGAALGGLVLLVALEGAAAEEMAPAAERTRPAHRDFFLSTLEELERAPQLTGGWGGHRARLAQLGIVPTATLVADTLGNPIGGERQDVAYFQNLRFDLDLDLEKLLGWPGGHFHTSFSSRAGQDLSKEAIGNVFTVSEVCCGPTARLVALDLEQSLLGDRVNVRAGRIVTGDDFLTSPLYWSFVNGAINGNPGGVFVNVPYSAYPVAVWGVRVRVSPNPHVYTLWGAYDGDPRVERAGAHGADFRLGDAGALLTAEAGLRGEAVGGLPGHAALGGWYHTGRFADLREDANGDPFVTSGRPPATRHGASGLYLMLDQMVHREAGPGVQGLIPFVALLVAPNEDVSRMPLFANAGIVYQGPIPGRDRDTAAAAVVYGRWSRELRDTQRARRALDAGARGPQTYEVVLEWTYTVAVTPWLNVQPDVQYIIRPGARGDVPNALVLGTEIAVSF